MISEERLQQLAYDPMVCNISPEVLECLRYLVEAKRLLLAYRESYCTRCTENAETYPLGTPWVCEICRATEKLLEAKDGQ
jgi:hypothetical protein